jgi:hypothetical protein
VVFYVDEITQVVQDRFGDQGKPLLFLLHGKNTDSGNFSKPASFEVLNVPLSALSFSRTQIMPINYVLLK